MKTTPLSTLALFLCLIATPVKAETAKYGCMMLTTLLNSNSSFAVGNFGDPKIYQFEFASTGSDLQDRSHVQSLLLNKAQACSQEGAGLAPKYAYKCHPAECFDCVNDAKKWLFHNRLVFRKVCPGY